MKSLAELAAAREKYKPTIAMRHDNANAAKIVVGMGTCGIAAGARPVYMKFVELVNEKQLSDVIVVMSGCAGKCPLEPIVEVALPGTEKVTYVRVTPEMAEKIVEGHIIGGKPVAEYAEATAK